MLIIIIRPMLIIIIWPMLIIIWPMLIINRPAVLLGLPAQAEGSGARPAALTGSIRTPGSSPEGTRAWKSCSCTCRGVFGDYFCAIHLRNCNEMVPASL
jgi:hypothetical protein